MAITQNTYDVSILSWNPDAVEPQLRYPAISTSVKLSASVTFPKGAIIAEVTATPGIFGLYVHSGSGGLGVPRAILPRAYVTDASGNVFEGGQASSEIAGVSFLTVPAFFSGVFKQSDLVTFDANALADWPGASVVRGVIASNTALIKLA